MSGALVFCLLNAAPDFLSTFINHQIPKPPIKEKIIVMWAAVWVPIRRLFLRAISQKSRKRKGPEKTRNLQPPKEKSKGKEVAGMREMSKRRTS